MSSSTIDLRHRYRLVLIALMGLAGCASSQPYAASSRPTLDAAPKRVALRPVDPSQQQREIDLAGYEYSADTDGGEDAENSGNEQVAEGELFELIAEAEQANPGLFRLEQEVEAAWARVPQVKALPDPVVGFNVFGRPMMMAEGDRLRGSFMASQTLPWLKQLEAQGQQAAYEALALEQEWKTEQQRIVTEVRVAWYRLYLLGQQIQVAEANQQVLQSLIEVATARVRVGDATQGDVLLGTLELSRIEEDLLTLRQQLAATKASMNELLNRPSDAPLPVPDELDIADRTVDLEVLRQLAAEFQPEIVAAELRTLATNWGFQVARLDRVPDVTVNYERMFMDMQDGGRDPWQIGLMVNVPLWRKKYAAQESEAWHRHTAAHASVDEVIAQYDALLLELREQARAARETARLYEETLLPQARQTLEVDQQAYAQGRVEFDRVVADVRNLLTLEIGYHRALAEWATALARLERAIGTELHILGELEPAPSPDPMRFNNDNR